MLLLYPKTSIAIEIPLLILAQYLINDYMFYGLKYPKIIQFITIFQNIIECVISLKLNL